MEGSSEVAACHQRLTLFRLGLLGYHDLFVDMYNGYVCVVQHAEICASKPASLCICMCVLSASHPKAVT